MTAAYLHKPGVICALGHDHDSIARQLFAAEPLPLTICGDFVDGLSLPLGQVSARLPELGPEYTHHNSRNNRLLLTAVEQISDQIARLRQQFAAHRIGVVLGTSTSGIAEAEQAFRHQQQTGELPQDFDYSLQEIGAPAQFLAQYLGLAGPATTISTACSSSAKALASARRLLQTNICDAVICGGVDTLCRLTVNGFHALDSVSQSPCNPCSRNRDGINIGEAAVVFVMSREPSAVRLSGCGESSDAYHISAPDPEAGGAIAAIEQALKDASLTASAIDYINLHGTATPQNDSMESLAVARVFGSEIACSSTKPLTGHTLGAAGALEAAFCWMTLTGDGSLPPHWWDGVVDPDLPALQLIGPGGRLPDRPQHALSNSFAFGGNNIALIFSASHEQTTSCTL